MFIDAAASGGDHSHYPGHRLEPKSSAGEPVEAVGGAVLEVITPI